MKALAVTVAQQSCIGARERNEDCIAVERLRDFWCLVLADGAGGHGDGEQAARLVVERVISGFRTRPPLDPDDLSELLLDAHDAVDGAQRAAAANGATSSMHATVVALVIDTATRLALWAHVGDSRLYVWRRGCLAFVTRDDSAVQRMIDTGLLDAARVHELRNRSVLLSAMGSAEDVVPHVSEPFEIEDADVFLLCSDGWWSGLEAQLQAPLSAAIDTPDRWLQTMLAQMQARADPRQDNHSAIACWIGHSSCGA